MNAAQLPAPQHGNPAASEAEGQLLGLVMFGHELPDELPSMPDGDWAEPINVEIWAAIRRLHRDGTRVLSAGRIAVLVGQSFEEVERANLHRLLDAYVRAAPLLWSGTFDATLEDLARAVRGLSAKRQLKAVAADIARLAEDPALSAPEALAQVDRDLAKLRIGDTLAPMTLRELTIRLAEDMEQPAEVMPTGLGRLDEVLGGGLWTRKLYGVAARMKVGKTLLLVTAARNVARSGHRALYVALEMGQAEVAQRIIADRLGINAVRFLRRDEDDLPARLVGYATRNDAPELDNLMFRDMPGCTFDQLRATAQAAVTRQGIKLLVVDYWQLVGGIPKGWNETQHLSAVAQWMADFARRAGIAILTAAQINRDGQTRGSDGLRLACDWYGHMHPAEPNEDRDRWIEGLDSRYTMRTNVGSHGAPALYVDTVGPVMREWR